MFKKIPLLFGLGVLLIIISIWQILTAQRGLVVVHLPDTNLPVTNIFPSQGDTASRPTILIAHGFSGSSQLMRGFAFTLAHAGFTTVLWDFQGHGGNPIPFDTSSGSSNLIKDAETAMAVSEITGIINTRKIAILGHSMGSGVALSYGIAHPETAATIAISPVYQTVTQTLPHNLLLMAGSLEPRFMNNAERLLNLAGGQNNGVSHGTGRKLLVIPQVEHISILFSPQAHAAALNWLNAIFGTQSGASNYSDSRVIWFGLGIVGFLSLANAIIGLIKSLNLQSLRNRPLWVRMIAILFGAFSATIILWLVSRSGVKINQSLGLLVGGYLIIWFGVAGVLSLVILKPQFYKPSFKEVVTGLISFTALWLGVGVLGNFIWLPWMLIPQRLILWIPGSILLLPWFLTIGYITINSKSSRRLGWWLFQVIVIILGLFLAISINPELGFLFIILPLVPVMIGLHMLAISSKYGIWAYASSGAMFISWLILAVFPLT